MIHKKYQVIHGNDIMSFRNKCIQSLDRYFNIVRNARGISNYFVHPNYKNNKLMKHSIYY